jgi:ABC-type oligopeptide transport system substrate-binding subunit
MKRLSILMAAVGASLLAASALGFVSQEPPGNTFRWSLTVDIDYVDPALSYYAPTWALTYATRAQLYNYPDAPAPRGSRLIPEVAASFPAISKDGRIYTFRLKKTFRLSNGRPVTAESFARAFFRVAHGRMGSWGFPYMADIVGAQAFHRGERASLTGIRVLGPQTLQIRLKKASGDLLARLAMPFFAAVPEGLAINPEGVRPPIPSAGPYFIREWTRNRRVILERNRFYRGPRPHRVNRIEVGIGLPLETIKLNIDRGATDVGDIPPAAHAELGRRYGVKRQSPGRYFVNSTTRLIYLAFNHDRELFGGPGPPGNVGLKKAVNFAIDRRQLMLQFGTYGGVVSDQLLPPTMPGFRDWKLYPRRPNLERARRFAAGNLRNAKGFFYCSNRSPQPRMCQSVQAQLRNIGMDMDVQHLVTRQPPFNRRGEAFDMTIVIAGLGTDFLDPAPWFDRVDGATIRPSDNVNLSYFSDPTFNRRIRLARRLQGERRYAAFAALDRDVVRDAAPIAPIGYLNDRHYVSARVGCYHHHPVFGWDFPAICLRR